MHPVTFSPTAEKGFENIREYIEASFGKKAAQKWMGKIKLLTEKLSQFPYACPKSDQMKELRRCFVPPATFVSYRFNGGKVTIFAIYDARRNQRI